MSLNSVTGVRNSAPAAVANAIAELQGLTFNILAGTTSNTAIAVTGIEIEDTVIKALNMTDLSEVTIGNVSIVDRRATGTLTLSGIVADDEVSVNGKVYTFVDAPAFNQALAPYEVAVGADDDASAENLAIAIMCGDNSLYASAASAVVTVIARTAGTGGNSIALVVANSNAHATRSGATLAGGTATNAIKISDDTSNKKILLVWYNKQ